MSFEEKLKGIIQKHRDLEFKLMDPGSLSSAEFTKTSKEHSQLQEIADLSKEYLKVLADIASANEIIDDSSSDEDFMEIAKEDLKLSEEKLNTLKAGLKIALLPKDEADEKNVILEIRAGTGGQEAALFASVLLRMYQRYAERRGWNFEILNISETGLDGVKDVSVTITGRGAFARFKYESGVHRVQRIPETESGGRIHTSAATVAVLPEAEELDIQIDENDLRIDVFRASGSGGQHVNTTDSAVRITHLPTGTVVSQQDEKSQHKNKARALKILRSRIYEHERSQRDAERSSMRKGMVGSGDRSERIRTYNYPQSRVTDHRINLTKYNLSEVIYDGALDEFIDALRAEDQAQKLVEVND